MNMIASYQSANLCKMKTVLEMMTSMPTYQAAGIRQNRKKYFYNVFCDLKKL